MLVRPRLAAALCGAVALAVPTVAALPAGAPPAYAATSPTIALSDRSFTGTGSHVITVTGRDYLVPPHAAGADVFGGVYLFFGWVKPGGAWGPSHRSSTSDAGTFGSTYAYPGEEGDAGTRDPGSGGIRFISFTAGGASGATTDEHMDDSGGWRVQLTVPGPTFRYTDSTGASRTVDCRTVTCGVFTIGAHGKASATNEVFTPVAFRATASATASPTPKPSRTASPKPSRTASSSPSRSGEPNAAASSASPSASPTGSAPPTTSAVPGAAVPTSSGTPSAPDAAVERLAVDAASSGSSGGAAGWLLLALAGAAVVGVLAAVLRRPGRRAHRGEAS